MPPLVSTTTERDPESLSLLRLPTTTQVERNVPRLRALMEHLAATREPGLSMFEIGPGAVLSALGEYLKRPPPGSAAGSTALFQAARIAETLLRKIPGLPLTTFEPHEVIREALRCAPGGRSIIGSLTIVDAFPQVERTVRDALKGPNPLPVGFVRFDLDAGSGAWRGPQADAACAYHAFERCRNRELAVASVRAMVKRGGVLSTTLSLSAREGFEPVDGQSGIYTRL